MADESRGLYRKYNIERTDGSSAPGGKHETCSYFVLDLEHDEFAIPALRSYAKACRATHPQLADSIDAIVAADRRCGCREAACPHVGLYTPNDMAERLMRSEEQQDG